MHHCRQMTGQKKETKSIIKSRLNITTKYIVIAQNLHQDFLCCCCTCQNTWEYPKHILVSMKASLEASQVFHLA